MQAAYIGPLYGYNYTNGRSLHFQTRKELKNIQVCIDDMSFQRLRTISTLQRA